MALIYGYCYDENGKFTEMIPIDEKPIYEKQTFYREEQKEVITEEKLCEFHQFIEDGTYEPEVDEETGEELPVVSKYECPDCVMYGVEYVPVKVPYEENVVVGYEPDIPENCTLEICPDLIYDPIFKDGKWIKLKPELPPQPEPEPSEINKLKAELEVTKAAMAEFIMQQTLKGM